MTFRGACGGAGLHCTPCLFLDNELRSVFTFFFFFFLPLLVYRFGKDLLIPDLSLKAENPQLQLLQYYKCIFFPSLVQLTIMEEVKALCFYSVSTRQCAAGGC